MWISTVLESNYVELADLNRKSSHVSNEKDQAEKIINEIVFMDAAYDLNQLPDLSTGWSIKEIRTYI